MDIQFPICRSLPRELLFLIALFNYIATTRLKVEYSLKVYCHPAHRCRISHGKTLMNISWLKQRYETLRDPGSPKRDAFGEVRDDFGDYFDKTYTHF